MARRQSVAAADKAFEVLDKTVCYDGFFRFERHRVRFRLFSGEWSQPIEREVLERGHAAAVLPYDPERDRVVLLEQFRAAAIDAPGGPWLIEIVAGIIEPGESAEAVIRREALEEAQIANKILVFRRNGARKLTSKVNLASSLLAAGFAGVIFYTMFPL